jgi:hypothetical protein
MPTPVIDDSTADGELPTQFTATLSPATLTATRTLAIG